MKIKRIFILLICLILTGCHGKMYKITFDTSGGSVMNSIEIEKGKSLEDIEEPTKEGYLFVNWLKDGSEYNLNTPITEDTKLTANWIEKPTLTKKYTVSFITDKYTEKIMVEENTAVEEPTAPKKKDYVFLGWFIGDEKYDFNSKVEKDIVLIAKYKLDTVTIIYDLDGGVGLSIETIQKNTSPSIPEVPTKEGYKFLKWTLNGEDFSFTSKISEDITLTANWEKIEYVIITFDTDGGKPITNMTLEKYSKVEALPVPTKEGYTFINWQLDGKTFNIGTTIYEDITLIAKYEEE